MRPLQVSNRRGTGPAGIAPQDRKQTKTVGDSIATARFSFYRRPSALNSTIQDTNNPKSPKMLPNVARNIRMVHGFLGGMIIIIRYNHSSLVRTGHSELLHRINHRLRHVGVQPAGRLVAKKNRWVGYNLGGERQPFSFSAGNPSTPPGRNVSDQIVLALLEVQAGD